MNCRSDRIIRNFQPTELDLAQSPVMDLHQFTPVPILYPTLVMEGKQRLMRASACLVEDDGASIKTGRPPVCLPVCLSAIACRPGHTPHATRHTPYITPISSEAVFMLLGSLSPSLCILPSVAPIYCAEHPFH